MKSKQRTPINEILAKGIAAHMARMHIQTQAELAKRAGLSQRTISNYLNPRLRQAGSSGKPPSAKLSEVEQIARALNTEAWDLLRDLTPKEREFYARIEDAYRRMTEDGEGSKDSDPAPPSPSTDTKGNVK